MLVNKEHVLVWQSLNMEENIQSGDNINTGGDQCGTLGQQKNEQLLFTNFTPILKQTLGSKHPLFTRRSLVSIIKE